MTLDKSLAMVAMMASGSAFASGEECASSADCAAGEQCVQAPCLPPDCDPSDPSCVVPDCPSTCIPDNSGGGGASTGECTTDADCGPGLSCQSAGTTGTACACPDDVPDCGCDAVPTEPVEYKACLPKTGCTSDADCGEGLECATVQVPCAVPAIDCAPGSECPEPEPCDTESYSVCQPKWAGTCEADADCGEGFSCKAYEVCSCSGGGATGSGGSSGGSEDPAAPAEGGASDNEGAPLPDTEVPVDDCTCEPSAEKYCEPQKTNCTTDADCVAGWTCMNFDTAVSGGSATEPACPEGQTCERPTEPASGDSSSGEAASGDAAPIVASDAWCVPPYYSDFATAGALPEEGPMADGEAFPAMDDRAGGDNQGGDGGETTGADGSGGSGSTDGTSDTTKDASSSSATAAGCTVEGRGSPASLAAIALALLAAFGLRRRA